MAWFCVFRSDHLSKHIKTHTKNRTNPNDPNSSKLEGELDKSDIKTELDGEGIATEESDEEGVELDGDGDGDLEDQEQDTGEMMITINTEGEQSELVIGDQMSESQS